MQTTATQPRTKIQLNDDERSKLRWSSTKRGFVAVSTPGRGPRGGRFRPVRSQVFRSLDAAVKHGDGEWHRYRQMIADVTVYEVDPLGNVVDSLPLDRPTFR